MPAQARSGRGDLTDAWHAKMDDVFHRLTVWRLTAKYAVRYPDDNPPLTIAEWRDLADTLVELFELLDDDEDH
jgi:hypothetical protein